MSDNLYDRVYGCLLGLAIGDALGVPVETMTHEQIMSATNGLGITGFIPPMQTRVKDTAGLKAGSTSDDTQLTLVTLRSLVKRGGFDLRDQAMELVDEYERTTFGWGGTTRIAAQELKDWRDSGGTLGRAPEQHAPEQADVVGSKKRGCGSGVAMRIAPLALHHLFPTRKVPNDAWNRFRADAMSLGLLTHSDPRASIAAITLGTAISGALLGDNYTVDNLRNSQFHNLSWRTGLAERFYANFRPSKPLFSEKLRTAFSLVHDPVDLRTQINTGFSALESVPFAIATALRHPNSFRTAVLEGVNAGQDTDTVGSMVGAIVGARVGVRGIPEEWIKGLDSAGSISYYATQLTDLIKHR